MPVQPVLAPWRALPCAFVLLAALTRAAPAAAADPAQPDTATPPAKKYEQKGKFPEELKDSDGDGVPDIDDNCPNTPPDPTGKTRIDACGCPKPAIDPCSLDSDGDGVNDCLDKCPNTYKGHIVGADGCPVPLSQSVRMRLDVKFAFDKAAIAPGFEADLLKLRDTLQRYPEIEVTLEGHTDWTGSADYNQRLSEQRAKACQAFILKDSGIAPERVKAAGYGKAKPIAPNSTQEGRAQNRRTVAEIHFDKTIVPANDQPPPLDFAPEKSPSAPSAPDDQKDPGHGHQ